MFTITYGFLKTLNLFILFGYYQANKILTFSIIETGENETLHIRSNLQKFVICFETF